MNERLSDSEPTMAASSSTNKLTRQYRMAERIKRRIVECAKSMMVSMQVDKKWWAEATNMAVICDEQSPMCSPPCQQDYAHIDKSKRTKLDDKEFDGCCSPRRRPRVSRVDLTQRGSKSRALRRFRSGGLAIRQ